MYKDVDSGQNRFIPKFEFVLFCTDLNWTNILFQRNNPNSVGNFERSAQITHSSMEKCKNSKKISHFYRSDLLCNHCYSIEFPSKPWLQMIAHFPKAAVDTSVGKFQVKSTAFNRVFVQHKNLPEFLDDDLVPKGNSKHLAKHIQWFVTVVIRCGLHCNWHRNVEPMRTSHGNRWKCSLVLCTSLYGKIFATAFQAAEWRIFTVISKLPDNWN